MSAGQSYDLRPHKAKKAVNSALPPANTGPSRPTTFFLRSEKAVDKSLQRGRKSSRRSEALSDDGQQTTMSASEMGGSCFGVQSLEDTMAGGSEGDLVRTHSSPGIAESSIQTAHETGVIFGRKRRAGNPVHPNILATGHRIISAEQLSGHPSSAASPTSLRSAESPVRSRLRRNSAASSLNFSRPITPLKMSPQPHSAMPSTPRTGSPKSFRLSDEEASVADETGSQAVQSSSGDDDVDADVPLSDETKEGSMPQLVMPSITMPSRRPFTERGRRMARLKLMIAGPSGVGKTSLINSICRSCEDIVHVDPALVSAPGSTWPMRPGYNSEITEMHASTRPYPSWWTDFQSRRSLHARRSIGSDSVLDRNLCFIEAPGVDREDHVKQVQHYVDGTMNQMGRTDRMHDSELINLLSAEGGIQIDAVLWLFSPSRASGDLSPQPMIDEPQKELLRYLNTCTNVIPLVGRADTVGAEELSYQKRQILDVFNSCSVEPYEFLRKDSNVEGTPLADEQLPATPFHISSALGDDAETIDASVLMSSQYMQPLIPSELAYLIEQLLDPINIARMRHLAATKFLLWRQQHMSSIMDGQITLRSPRFNVDNSAVPGSDNMPGETSKDLVPSPFRSVSPSASDSSADIAAISPNNKNAIINTSSKPFREVRLARWAQDLQRSLANERKRYTQFCTSSPPLQADWTSDDGTSNSSSEKHEHALVSHGETEQQRLQRPPRGRLGGDIAIIDPRDPLGVLALGQTLGRRSWFALRVAGGCGFVGVIAFWVVRNWVEVQEFFVGGAEVPVLVRAVPAPERGPLGWLLEGWDWRGFFGWRG